MLQAAIQHLQSEYGVTVASATDWAMSAAILVGAAIVALLLHGAALFVARRVVGERQSYPRTVLAATKGPTRLALLLIALAAALPTAPLSSETAGVVARILGLATICLMGWIAVTALHIAADLYLMRFRLDAEDNLLARKHYTQVRVLERVVDVVIVLITVGFALMTFDAVRQFGVTLFASAGVACIVAGLAARPVLTNFLAGVQLAVAQPIRIDDTVIVENESGTVEEITFSYVVLKLWDLRRMVVPLSYFIEKPFQNWTRTGGELIGTVFLYVDHTAPVEAIRNKLTEIASQSKSWNGKCAEPPSQRLQGDDDRIAGAGQRQQRLGRLGPALRGAREADRVSAARASFGAAAATLPNRRGCRVQSCYTQARRSARGSRLKVESRCRGSARPTTIVPGLHVPPPVR
jgi:small-conductance mechanosensitive channel